MRGVATSFALAALIGFLTYRAALATLPADQYQAAPPPGCTGTVSNAHFDAITGLPIPAACMHGDGETTVGLWASTAMYEHFARSVWLGMAVIVAACFALWWFGRRRFPRPAH